jgi:hypothetical protein
MSCGGLNQFLSLTVPPGNGDGPSLDVSGLVAQKTLYLAGTFGGTYVILGSHDDVNFVPIAMFDGGEGPQTIRRDVKFTLKTIRVRRQANKTVVINVAGQATCAC